MPKAINWETIGTDDDRSYIRFIIAQLKDAGISAKSTSNTPYVGHRALEIDGSKLIAARRLLRLVEGSDGFWVWAIEQTIRDRRQRRQRGW